MTGFADLTPKQSAAIEALTKARTFGEAAKLAGVDRDTLRAWLRDDEAFRGAYRAVKADAFEGLALGLLNLSEAAIAGYAEVLANPAIPGSMTLSRTSEAVISQLFRLRELMDIEERLEALEAQLAGQGMLTYG